MCDTAGSISSRAGTFRSMNARADPRRAVLSAGSREIAVVGASMVATAIFSLRDLGQRSFWQDEGASAFGVTGSNARLANKLIASPQFGLYHLLLRSWSILGSSEFTLRLLSTGFAVLTVPALYGVARHLYGARAAMVTVLLVSVNGFFLGYAQEARPYSLVVLTSTVATLTFLRALALPERRGRWDAWVIAATVATLSHPFGGLTFGAHVIVLGMRRRSLPVRDIAYALALPAGLLASLVLLLLEQGPARLSWIRAPDSEAFGHVAYALTGSNGAWTFFAYLFGTALLVVAAARARSERRRELRSSTVVALAVLVTPFVGALLVSIYQPVFVTRYLIVTLTPLVVLVGAGVAQLRPLPATAVTAVLILIALPTATTPIRDAPIQDWRGAAQLIRTDARADDLVIAVPYGREVISYYLEAHGGPSPRAVEESPFLEDVPAALRPCHLHRVWMVIWRGPVESTALLNATHDITQSWQLRGIEVQRLDRRPTAPPSLPAEQPCS